MHIKKKHIVGGVTCDIDNCGKNFVTTALLNAHIKKDHKYKCDVCGLIFNDKLVFDTHVNTHGKKPDLHLCPFNDCGENHHINGFNLYNNMKLHVLTYHVKLCEKCWKAFNSDKKYSKHVCTG